MSHRYLGAFVRVLPVAYSVPTGDREPEATRLAVYVDRVLVGHVFDRGFCYWSAERLDGTVLQVDASIYDWRKPMFAMLRALEVEGLLPELPPAPRTLGEWMRYGSGFSSDGRPAGVARADFRGAWGWTQDMDELRFPRTYSEKTSGGARFCTFTQAQYAEARAYVASELAKMAAVQARYVRFCRYVTEVKPAWQAVREIGYADNSTDLVEESAAGVRRTRTIIGPSGDACF